MGTGVIGARVKPSRDPCPGQPGVGAGSGKSAKFKPDHHAQTVTRPTHPHIIQVSAMIWTGCMRLAPCISIDGSRPGVPSSVGHYNRKHNVASGWGRKAKTPPLRRGAEANREGGAQMGETTKTSKNHGGAIEV